MAKITAPLFSISASGTIGKKVTFRATKHGNRAGKPPVPSPSATIPQQFNRQQMRDAAVTWYLLDQPDRDEWQLYGAPVDRSGWVAFFTEYVIQQCQPPEFPLVPATVFEEP
jgi:hypothetical protein